MDTVFLALRVVVSLGAVLGAIWFLHRWLTKGGKSPARRAGKAITVVARQSLGAKASVAVVETDGRRFLLGVTEQAITVLDRIDIEVAAKTTAIEIPAASVQATARAVAEFAEADYLRASKEAAQAEAAQAEAILPAPPAAAAAAVPIAPPLPAPPGSDAVAVLSDGGTHGGVPRLHPSPVVSFEQALSDARAMGARQEAAAELSAAEIRRPLTAPIPLLPATRRALREAEAAQAATSGKRTSERASERPSERKAARAAEDGPARRVSGSKASGAKAGSRAAEKKSPLAGSILSPDTWRQTAEALRRAR